MRALGRELGVTHGALYRYFPDLKAVLAALGAEVTKAMTPPPTDLPWQDWLRQAARAQRRVMREHPEVADPATWSAVAPAAHHMLAVGMSVLGRTFAPPDALLALGAVSRIAYGFARSEPEIARRPVPPLSAELVAALKDANPILDVDVVFERELDIVIAGIEATLSKITHRGRRRHRSPKPPQ